MTIRGLSLNGALSASSDAGIRYLQGASLTVEDVDVRGVRGAAPDGYGIIVNNTTGTTKLTVINSVFVNNGDGPIGGAGGGGIQIAPIGSGNAQASIENSQFINNTVGVRADASGTTGAIDVTASRTIASRGTFHGFRHDRRCNRESENVPRRRRRVGQRRRRDSRRQSERKCANWPIDGQSQWRWDHGRQGRSPSLLW